MTSQTEKIVAGLTKELAAVDRITELAEAFAEAKRENIRAHRVWTQQNAITNAPIADMERRIADTEREMMRLRTELLEAIDA